MGPPLRTLFPLKKEDLHELDNQCDARYDNPTVTLEDEKVENLPNDLQRDTPFHIEIETKRHEMDLAWPMDFCNSLSVTPFEGKVVLMSRGICNFQYKVGVSFSIVIF